MIICNYKGFAIAVLLRNEHCPPHVHVDGIDWQIRIKFSFCHSDTEFWDAKPLVNKPTDSLINDICQELKKQNNLSKARKVWMTAVGTTCLDNKYWDSSSKNLNSRGQKILKSTYNESTNKTVIELAGSNNTVEISL